MGYFNHQKEVRTSRLIQNWSTLIIPCFFWIHFKRIGSLEEIVWKWLCCKCL